MLSDQTSKTNRIQLGSETDHLARRQFQSVGSEVGQNIDRVADHHNDGILLHPCRIDLLKDLEEQICIAIDKIQSTFVGLPSKPRRDANHIA